MTFPKNATLAGQPVTIIGPHVSVHSGQWHYSHVNVIAEFEVVTFLANVDEFDNIEITEDEQAELEAATSGSFPDVIRIARAITGQG